MYFKQDWLMREIDMSLQFVARVLFNKDYLIRETFEIIYLTQTDPLAENLLTFLAKDDVCGAEDHLFDHMEKNNKEHLTIALNFYETLNTFSETELDERNFSREEVSEGLKEVLHFFEIIIPYL